MATITGTSGSETLNGTSGNDTLNSLGGNDTLVASGGTDFYDGGTGFDNLDVRTAAAGVVISFADGTISGGFSGTFVNMEGVLGSNLADSLIGGAGNQKFSARGGNDTLEGGTGNDTLWGGGGADAFVFRETGTANADSIADFASGEDKIVLDARVMSALGANGIFAAGDDRFAANSTGTAQDANDRVIFNTTTNQVFYDADGNGAGAAMLIATLQSGATLAATDIVVEGGSGGQVINGTAGNDALAGGAGNDSISGLGGDDTIRGLDGDDIIDGGMGLDSMIGGSGADVYYVDNAGDVIIEEQLGGMDLVYASVSYALPAWVNNLTLTGTALLEGTGNDINNVLVGNDRPNLLSGGLGADTLTGGAGADRFLFATAPAEGNGDSITDFTSGSDRIVLDGSVMPGLGANGTFFAGDARFAANSTGTAQDASDRVVFNTTTRQLFYDADGNGSGAAVLIATLQSGATLVATDIAVINSTGPTISGTEGNDSISGTDADDTIYGLAGDDTLTGLAGDDVLDGGDGFDSLSGGEGNDTLVGGFNPNSAAQALNGGPGADMMIGGLGNDVFYVDDVGDSVADGSGGYDIVVSSVSFVAPAGVDQVSLVGSGSINATGNGLNNSLHGNSGANRLEGLGANDWIDGMLGDDSLLGGDGNDTLVGGEGADTIDGGAGSDRLDGGPGHDWLVGGEGSDIFVFGQWAPAPNDEFIADFQSGVDKLELDGTYMSFLGASGGFAADDARFYSAAGATAAHDVSDRIIYNTSNGALYFDRDGTGSTWQAELIATLQGGAPLAATDIVVINGSTSSGSTVTGTAGNDSLVGTWWNDQMEGLAGDDTVRGGDGNDLVLGGDGNDSVFGEWGSDTVEGGAGDDWLEGGYGTDTLFGGEGNDTLDGGWDSSVIYTGGGADRVVFLYEPWAARATIFDFAPGIDELAIDRAVMPEIGAAGDFVAGDERFYAAAGATSGHDTTDRIVYDTSSVKLYYDPDGSGSIAAQLIASFTVGTSLAATDITIIDSNAPKHLIGTSGNDTLYGRAGDDTIEGLGGNDYIGGAAGNDSLLGGDGDDTINAGDGSDTADGGAGNDYIYGSSYYDDDGTSERFAGGEGDDTLYGGEGDDALTGGNGHDYLWGGGGADTLDGGLGNDTIAVESTSAVIIDEGGIDTIIAVEQDWVLGDGFENLRVEGYYGGYYYYYGSAGHRILIGNSLDNHIDGSNASSAQIQGLDGNDTLLGGWGDSDIDLNILDGGSGNDLLKGTSVTDRLLGGTGNDSLEANYGADVLDGGEGNDTLVGGPSSEWRPGGDLFRFSVTPGDSNADRIVDFVSGDDTIEFVNAAHAGIGASGYFAADDERFHAADGATGGAEADDRVVYDTSTGNLYYDADGSGSGAALLVATLQNAPTLVASDLIVTGDSIGGSAGNDSITGTPADDTIDGAAGDDTIAALAGNDIVLGGAGHDSLQGGDGSDHVIAGDGNDTLDGGSHIDTLDGGFGDDTYFVDDGDVLVDAGGVEHVIAVWSWTLGDGFENLTADNGRGNALDNQLTGKSTWSSTLYGMEGNDTLEAAGGYLDGGAGNDVIRVTSANWTNLYGGDGNDSITGAGGSDWIHGNRGNDTMAGGAGSDNFAMYNNTSTEGAAYGQDQIDGGEGFDWIRFDGGFGRTTGIAADLAAGTLSGGGASGDGATFTNIEAVAGTEFNDSISGSAAGNSLWAGAGADLLDGRAGFDTLTGGDGADVFLFAVAPGTANADHIGDFVSGTDKIHLDAAVMPALGTSGAFAPGDERFHIGTAALEADDRVVYNSANGQLSYDADGSGSGAAELIATLFGARILAATDIVVINSAPPPPPPPEGAVINGTAGMDTLSGTAGDDTINGFESNDLFLAGSTGGNDVINGGGGRDSIEFKERATSAIVVDFGAGTITGGSSGTITFTSIERVVTGNFNDILTGNAASQTLTGQSGSDTIWGAGGADTLWGVWGADVFVFREMGTANADRISDFASGSDKLHLDDAAFTAIGAMGDFAAGDARFKANGTGTATDTNDRVVFNTSTGQLYYDADGSAGGAAQLIATVQTGATVAATDIVVI